MCLHLSASFRVLQSGDYFDDAGRGDKPLPLLKGTTILMTGELGRVLSWAVAMSMSCIRKTESQIWAQRECMS